MIRPPALLSIPVLAVAVLLVLWMARGLEEAAPLAEDDTAQQPRYELVAAQWTRLDETGQRQLLVEADTIRWFDDRSAEMTQPRVSGLGGVGSPWNVRSPEGKMAARSDDVLLTGPVLATGRAPDGEPLKLETSRLWIDTRDKQLQTRMPVSLTGPSRQVKAVGMQADWDGQSLKLLNDVEVHYARSR